MTIGTNNRAFRHMERTAKGQAMTEFVFMAFVAFIILFVAIQMAALGREAMALGQLNYQVTRWATDLGNNSIRCQWYAVNSPQCTDVANLINGTNITSAVLEHHRHCVRVYGKDRIRGWPYRLRKPTSRRNWRRDDLRCCRRHGRNTLRRAKAGRHGSADHSDHGHS